MNIKLIPCLLVLSGAVFAAAPTVTIDDNLNAVVDGSSWGKAGDTIVNNKDNAALVVAVNNALKAKLTAFKAAADASIAAAQSKAASDVATAQTERDAARAERDAAVAAKAAAESDKAKIVAAVKAIPDLPAEAQKAVLSAADKERAALEAQKAEIEAKLAKFP